MIDLPSYGPTTRIRLGNFLRMRPLLLNYEGIEKLENFQVRCILSTRDIPFEKLRSDRQDLLFIDNNNEIIPYWIEEVSDTQIKLWLRFPKIVPGTETFWLYFGNTNFSGLSNGEATFEFFDDFRDANRWIIAGSNPDKITINETEGRIEWNGLTKKETTRAFRKIQGIGSLNNFIIEIDKMKFTSRQTYSHGYFATIANTSQTPDEQDTLLGFSAPYEFDDLNPRVKIAGEVYSPSKIKNVSWSSFRWISIVKHADTVIYRIFADKNRTLEIPDSPKSNTDPALNGANFGDYIFAVSAYNVGQSFPHSGFFYRLKIRKYTDPQPFIVV